MYSVQVIDFSTKDVVKKFKDLNLRSAEKVETGVQINMNHEQYFTSIIDQESGEEV
jgi:hypothetical protein